MKHQLLRLLLQVANIHQEMRLGQATYTLMAVNSPIVNRQIRMEVHCAFLLLLRQNFLLKCQFLLNVKLLIQVAMVVQFIFMMAAALLYLLCVALNATLLDIDPLHIFDVLMMLNI